MRLGVKAETPDREHGDIIRADSQPLAPCRPRCIVGGEILRFDAQRDDRQLRQRQACAAGALVEIVLQRLDDRQNGAADADRGADYRIPWGQRRGGKRGDLADHFGRGDAEGDAEERKGLCPQGLPPPHELRERGRREGQAADLGQPGKAAVHHPFDLRIGAVALGLAGKVPGAGGIGGVDVEAVGLPMAEQRGQKAFARHLPPHHPARGVEVLRVIMDGRRDGLRDRLRDGLRGGGLHGASDTVSSRLGQFLHVGRGHGPSGAGIRHPRGYHRKA